MALYKRDFYAVLISCLLPIWYLKSVYYSLVTLILLHRLHIEGNGYETLQSSLMLLFAFLALTVFKAQ